MLASILFYSKRRHCFEDSKIISHKSWLEAATNKKDWSAVIILSEPVAVNSVSKKTNVNDVNIENAPVANLVPAQPDSYEQDFQPLKRFADGATPICYKEGNVNGKRSSYSTTYRIIDNRYGKGAKSSPYQGTLAQVLANQDLKAFQKSYSGLSLIKKGEKWFIKDHTTGNVFKPEPKQSYIFVTMPDKTIRIAPSAKGGHVILADYAREIRYAGEVIFDSAQRIHNWNNRSGGYYPPPFLAVQAGLEVGKSRFTNEYDRNDSEKQLAQTFHKLTP